MLAAAGCKGANFAKPDGGGGRDGNASDVAQPNTCPPEIPSQSKGKAQSCSCDRECQTGFCVDGICCNEACTETCKACDLPSSLGVCAPVPSGVKPSVALQCVASSPATCGLDGTCDGNDGCRKFEKETPCKAGTCDGDGVTGILTCDGNGNCSDPISKICQPWTCDPTTSDCTHDCATDAQCSPGHQCVSGRCGKGPNGTFCDTADQCDSGFCADGVCCNLACSSSCMSCNQTGSVGHCAAIPAGQHDPACGGGDPTTCGNTGVCDGFGSCTLYPKDTVCGPSSCSGLSENTPRTCDGQGTCGDSHPLDCSPFLCTNTACANVCKLDSDCAPGKQCVLKTVNGVTTGSCGPKQNGQSCASPSECLSSQCVDGVCCENSCAGACQSCNLPSSPGRCLNVANNAPDQHNICQDLGATSCVTNGLCDGNGACQNYPAATQCSQETCVAGLHTPASQCDGSGKCVPSDPISCDPYVCNGPTCFKSCTSSSIQCISGKFCTNASCGPKPNGAECSLGTECLSTFCAQGACCDSACLGACMNCNLKAAPGHCTAVADKSQDPQNICTAKSSDTCGTTGTCLGGKCADYDKGTNCKAASCATPSSVTSASTCDGNGSCVQGGVYTCVNQTCVSGSCQGVCGPGQVQCSSNNGVQTCTTTGSWGAAVSCKSSACLAGACTGSCTPGDQQCSGNGVQTCDSTGQLGKPVDCGNQACSQSTASTAKCIGTCAPQSTKCADDKTLQTCSATGTWVNSTCSNTACVNGACSGSCAPDGTKCADDKTLQTCSATGTWVNSTCSKTACVLGACTGSCAPDSTQCLNDKTLQTCSATGTWVNSTCSNTACVNGACSGSCAPDSTQCLNDKTLQTCSATGTWVNSTCSNTACVLGTCTGSCAPDSTQCLNDKTLQTCSATGTWVNSTCTNACVSGACGGLCSPGATQCSSDNTGVLQCSTAGTWPASPSPCTNNACANGACTDCIPGAKQCSSDNTGVLQCSTAGTWPASPSPCTNNACANGACTDCIPGAKQCSSDNTGVLQCSTAGTWPASPSPCTNNACANGACTDCIPNSIQCVDNSAELCDNTGHWGNPLDCGNQTCSLGVGCQ